MDKPTLSQISALAEAIQRNDRINTHFDTSNAFTLLRNISLAQKKLIVFLLAHGYYRQKTGQGKCLYDVLKSLNFKIIF